MDSSSSSQVPEVRRKCRLWGQARGSTGKRGAKTVSSVWWESGGFQGGGVNTGLIGSPRITASGTAERRKISFRTSLLEEEEAGRVQGILECSMAQA